MTNYNERLTEILRELDQGEYLDKGGVPGAKQALTSLTKELVAEAKPEVNCIEHYKEIEQYLDRFEENLLKALEEK